MLQGDDGLPLSPAEGRRQRAEGRYPLDIAWDGILVDDPEHPLDIERRVHDALAVIWGDRADAIQQEACELLGVPTLREWFRRPAGFFADHLKRYSKSRRQAPIYWPLSTPGGRYTVWLYYHRFSKDTLYRALEQVAGEAQLRGAQALAPDRGCRRQPGGRGARRPCRPGVPSSTELRVLREELTRVAPLWNPDLNDGVILNYGPLWRMIGHTPWQKARQGQVGRAGRRQVRLGAPRHAPLARAGGAQVCHGPQPGHRPRAGGRLLGGGATDGKWREPRTIETVPTEASGRKVPDRIDRLVAERTSAAVKDALKSLLEAPAPVAGRGGGRRSSARGPSRRASAGPRSGNGGGRAPSSAGPRPPMPPPWTP